MEEAASVCNWYSLGATKAIVYLTDFTLAPPKTQSQSFCRLDSGALPVTPETVSNRREEAVCQMARVPYRGRYYN